jgi:hypothetical protein
MVVVCVEPAGGGDGGAEELRATDKVIAEEEKMILPPATAVVLPAAPTRACAIAITVETRMEDPVAMVANGGLDTGL